MLIIFRCVVVFKFVWVQKLIFCNEGDKSCIFVLSVFKQKSFLEIARSPTPFWKNVLSFAVLPLRGIFFLTNLAHTNLNIPVNILYWAKIWCILLEQWSHSAWIYLTSSTKLVQPSWRVCSPFKQPLVALVALVTPFPMSVLG